MQKRMRVQKFKKMSQRLKEWLVEPELLQMWAQYSLAERVRIIQRVFNEYVAETQLRSFYIHSNISHLSTTAMKHIELANNPELETERKSFA